jgi:1-acyl-sn-glycerol-3-phosphate acyltransferase
MLITIPLIAIFRSKKGIIIHYANRLIMFLIGGKVISSGGIDINADMYIFNHQGIIDIIAFEALQKGHSRWVAKKELFDIPYIGHLLRLGEMISVDRSDKRGLMQLMKNVEHSKTLLKRPVAIFPEGTRAKSQKLLSFKQGTKAIVEKLKLRVQPVVITGSKNLLDEGIKTAHNGIVKYTFLDSIDINNASDDWYTEVETKMQEVIDNEYKYSNRSR